MFSKKYLTIFLAAAVCLIGSLAVSAQVAQTRGTVVLINADNTTTPVVGAAVDTYRTDINQKGPTAKTNKKGEFQFAGLQLGATYLISVSGENLTPVAYPNIKAGNEAITIKVTPGDGKRFTEAEARAAIKAPAANQSSDGTNKSSTAKPAELTAEQKKQQEEYNKQVADVTTKNEKIKNSTAIVQSSFKEGNDALTSKNYDLAISKYDVGIAAVPDFVGSTPTLLNNKAVALRSRATQVYNDGIKNPDPTAKLAAMTRVKKDLADSADAYNQAWTVIKNAPSADVAATANLSSIKADTLKGSKETFRIMAATEQVEPTKIEIAKVLIPEYLSAESDAAEKTKAQVILGDIYRVSNDSDNAIIEYKKVLETSPDNLEALSGVGFSLVNLGYINSDKTKMQEGANYLQKFYNAAPDTNKYKADAKGLIDTLKTEQNVTPQKLPAKKKG